MRTSFWDGRVVARCTRRIYWDKPRTHWSQRHRYAGNDGMGSAKLKLTDRRRVRHTLSPHGTHDQHGFTVWVCAFFSLPSSMLWLIAMSMDLCGMKRLSTTQYGHKTGCSNVDLAALLCPWKLRLNFLFWSIFWAFAHHREFMPFCSDWKCER